mmetsp:Transcript_28464/g.45865  ORF Transcript_28464/g.45865 Transcript_28464/m.45865 type:complete len:796 (-) Transcript_28464:88-2475(-)
MYSIEESLLQGDVPGCSSSVSTDGLPPSSTNVVAGPGGASLKRLQSDVSIVTESQGSVYKVEMVKDVVGQDENEQSSLGSCVCISLTRSVEPFSYCAEGFGVLNVAQTANFTQISVEQIYYLSDTAAFPCVSQLHTLSGGRAMFWLEFDLDVERLCAFHTSLTEGRGVAVVRLGKVGSQAIHEREICMVAITVKKNDPSAEKRGFLIYAVPTGSVTYTCARERGSQGYCPSLLQNTQLGLVFGVEHTLMCTYDLERNPPPREAELAMLQQFDQTQTITLPGGIQVASTWEETIVDSQCCSEDQDAKNASAEKGEPKEKRQKVDGEDPPENTEENKGKHRVLRLQSPEGELIFVNLEVDDEKTTRSLMVHIRPGWQELRKYMLNGTNDGKGTNRVSLFRVFCLFKMDRPRREALELWRLLDSDGSLLSDTGGWESAETRLYSRSSGAKRDIRCALQGYKWDTSLTFAIDNSTRWTDGLSNVWPVRPYDPYTAPNDFGLAGALHAIHNMRNSFFERFSALQNHINLWLQTTFSWDSKTLGQDDKANSVNEFRKLLQPSIPDINMVVQVQKHRWLQEFQAPQNKAVPKELASAKDFADPILRNKWHLIVDTNVLHNCAEDQFEFFRTLEHTHGDSIVLVIPFATMNELDWQKHHVKKGPKLENAVASIRFLNRQQAAGSRFIVIQTNEEDAPFHKKHKAVKPFNLQNDMRVIECAKVRHVAGCRVIMLSEDTNLRNICLSSRVPAVPFRALWQMLSDRRYHRLGPEQWLHALQKQEKTKLDRQRKHLANQQSVKHQIQ